ncbi:MAG: hypothetical protein ACRCZ9_02110 [Fusobacteriaceae bacterium]
MDKDKKKKYEKLMDLSAKVFLFPLLPAGYFLKLYDKFFKKNKDRDSSAKHKNFYDL